MSRNRGSAWSWVPSLYFAEGIPYCVVNVISVIMFKKLGVPNGDMALYTSMLYLPWVIKPIWSPFVDIIKTKRWWVLCMQILMTVCFAALAFSIPSVDIYNGISPFRVTLLLFWIVAFASATHDIAADGFYMYGLNEGDQSFFVGIRNTFYRLANIFGQGVLVVIAGVLEMKFQDVPMAWRVSLMIVAVLFALMSLWHIYSIPKPVSDVSKDGIKPKRIFKEFIQTFISFFKKPYVLIAILFMLLYRLPEAFLVKMMNPFLLDSVQNGGLGLGTEELGLVYGTCGVAALTIGGILGGFAIAKWGLKKCLWPMSLSLALPCLAFIWLSWSQTQNLWIIASFVVIDQFGYGFGFTAYMLYMMYFSQGEYKTAHYSLCTAFMALSMMLPGMVAGYIQESLGYFGFFCMVGLCCLVTIFATLLIKVDGSYGKK